MEIARECWYISDQIHTSYEEAKDMSITERRYLIKFINEKIENTNKAMEESKAKYSQRNKN